MTILPHAASRQRPSADLLAQKLAACNLNKIFFPGYTVVACVRTRESLTLKLETTEPAIYPKCGESFGLPAHFGRPRVGRKPPYYPSGPTRAAQGRPPHPLEASGLPGPLRSRPPRGGDFPPPPPSLGSCACAHAVPNSASGHSVGLSPPVPVIGWRKLRK